MEIKVTDAAVKELKRVIAENAVPAEAYVRVGVKGGGCSGFTNVLEFDDEPLTNNDVVMYYEGLRIVADKKSLLYIDGSTLDFHSDTFQSGFKFENPNAKHSCGCGKSFAV